jgi:hypothetical protein
MPQLTIYDESVYNLPSKDIAILNGNQGSTSYGNTVSYSTTFYDVSTLFKSREIVANVNKLLDAKGENAITWFLYDNEYYIVL